MIFRTELTPEHPGFNISHAGKMLVVGSCFAESIGQKLLMQNSRPG